MLHNIPAILSPDILWSLRAMGHGDTIVIADANFPATRSAERCHRLDGISATEVLEAILTVMPLDSYVPDPAVVMQVVGDPSEVPGIVTDFQTHLDRHTDIRKPVQSVERFEFYKRARAAFAVIQTGETRLYGNIILTKGVIGK